MNPLFCITNWAEGSTGFSVVSWLKPVQSKVVITVVMHASFANCNDLWYTERLVILSSYTVLIASTLEYMWFPSWSQVTLGLLSRNHHFVGLLSDFYFLFPLYFSQDVGCRSLQLLCLLEENFVTCFYKRSWLHISFSGKLPPQQTAESRGKNLFVDGHIFGPQTSKV